MTESKIKEENQKIKNEIKQHQSALESLKSADPEFYKHLQEMDGNLLAFGDDDQYDLGELGDIDDAVGKIQKDKINAAKREIDIDENEDNDDDDNDDTSNDDEPENEDMDAFMDDDEEEENEDEEVSPKLRKKVQEEVQFSDGGSDEDVDDDNDFDEGDDLIDDIVDEAMFEFDVSELQELIKKVEEEKSMYALKKMLNGFCSFVELTMEDDKKSKV